MLPPESIALSHEIVHRGIDLATFLRGYRVGHALVMDALEAGADGVDLDPDLRWRVLTRISRYLFSYVDALSLHVTETYAEERARWVRGAVAARAELVEALLAGEEIDPDRATATLGYDVRPHHIAFLMWLEPSAQEAGATGGLEAGASSVAQALGGGPLLVIPVGARALWAWTSGRTLTDRPSKGPPELPKGMRAALGTPAPGLAGFVRSHRQAQTAREVARVLPREPSIVRYSSTALMSVLTGDPMRALAFVESELGELASDDDAAGRLRATLRVYFEEGASPARAARRLSIHHNTVVYCVHQVEEMLGHPIKDRRLEVEAALHLAESVSQLRAAVQRTVR